VPASQNAQRAIANGINLAGQRQRVADCDDGAIASSQTCDADVNSAPRPLNVIASSEDRTMINRRTLIVAASAGLGTLGMPAIVRSQTTRIVKMGSLRLIHSMTPHFYEKFAPANIKIEITTFDSPTDGKNAVVTNSVDFGGFGIAAATLGAAAGEPVVVVGAFCNKGMGIVSKAGSDIKSVKDLRGKKVGIWPGSTQEVFIMERLRMEGMTVRDVQSTRVPFGEMHAMLSRGDIDAYVGAEPGPGLSLSSGVGQLVEYPYSTSMGGLNMIFGTSEDMVTKDPELVKTMLTIHRKASEYMMSNKAAVAEMTTQKLGAKKEAVENALAADNVEYIWNLDDKVLVQARTYAQQMLELKQIRALPDFTKFLNPTFAKAVAAT
jgi:NitT/TauT family transport system substrate-binding protein